MFCIIFSENAGFAVFGPIFFVTHNIVQMCEIDAK